MPCAAPPRPRPGGSLSSPDQAAGGRRRRCPRSPTGWTIELVAQAPEIVYPTAIVAAPDGTIYLGQDPMDMPGPPTEPIDSVVAIRDGKVSTFADKLWGVMGLEWVDGTLYVVHAPFLSAFRDTDGDGKADAAGRPDHRPRARRSRASTGSTTTSPRASGWGWTGSSTSRSATRASRAGSAGTARRSRCSAAA